MFTKLITVVETVAFLRQAQSIWTDDERAVLVDYLARHPESGDLIPGTGGIRKVRWSRSSIRRERTREMAKDFGDQLIDSLNEAVAHARGGKTGSRVNVVEVSDAKAIRERLGMSQQEFARAYQIPLSTLQGWEQGRRQPDATASAYLKLIASLPQEARAVLAR
ncbi:MAG: NadS family protein [Sphingomonadales bacterium]